MSLSKSQLKMVKEAIGDGSDWPKITDDPMVNHKVDQLVSNPELSDWTALTTEEKELYKDDTKLRVTDNKQFRILHNAAKCPRVALRLICDDCGYPASEARYLDESELPKE